jgi:Fe2+ transport system protein B
MIKNFKKLFFLITIFSGLSHALAKDTLTINSPEVQDMLIEKLEEIKSSAQTKDAAIIELKNNLKQTYAQIDNTKEKELLNNLLTQLSSKKTEKYTIKRTILKSIENFVIHSTPKLIICTTIIIVLYQLKGIITTQETIVFLDKIDQIIATMNWGKFWEAVPSLVTPVTKLFGGIAGVVATVISWF